MSLKVNEKVITWLFENSNPIIKHLLIKNHNYIKDINTYKKQALETDIVKYWINSVNTGIKKFKIHGSFDYCLENALGELIQLGIAQDINNIDEISNLLLEKLKMFLEGNNSVFKYNWTNAKIVAAFLSKIGYENNNIVVKFTQSRIDEINELIHKYGFDIFVDKSDFKGIPSAFKHKPLINPDISNDNTSLLPSLFDIILFQCVIKKDSKLYSSSNLNKINKIIEYIFSKEYQNFIEGYGIQYSEGNKYYATGWNIKFPKLNIQESNNKIHLIILYLEVFSHFPESLRFKWFNNALKLLESYITKEGTYIFPKDFLREKSNSYFILGGHMGLGENRRKKIWNEIESTLWMLKIKKNMA